MKLNFFLVLITFVLSSGYADAQDLRITVDKKGNVGFADPNGNVVIGCKYESAQPFKNGLSVVTKSGKSGLIDATGKEVLPLKYTQISEWNDKLFLIKSGKKQGLADRQGTIVLKPDYSVISKPNCYGKALIAKGGKATQQNKKTYMLNAAYGIIDADGNVLIAPQYKGLFEFSKEVAANPYHEGKLLSGDFHFVNDTLVTDCQYLGFNKLHIASNAGVMDAKGQVLLKPNTYTYVMQPKSGMMRYYVVKKKNTLCGYYDLSAGKGFQVADFEKPLAEITYWTHGDFIGQVAPVNGTTWSFIDKQGNKLRSGYSSLIHSTATGLWAAKNASEKWDVFDESNTDVSELSGYTAILFPKNADDAKVFSVQKDGKSGCIARDGKVVVPFDYEKATANTYDVIALCKDGKWGAVSPDNTRLIPFEYKNLILPEERGAKHFWVQKDDSLFHHLNLTTGKVCGAGFKAVANFAHGVAHVVSPDMKVEDNLLNRAQIFAPNTDQATMAKADFSKFINTFGYLVGTDDTLVFDRPVSTLYKGKVIEEMKKCGKTKLSQGDMKNILLKVTENNRSYDLKATLDEAEWNY